MTINNAIMQFFAIHNDRHTAERVRGEIQQSQQWGYN